jgi:large subunit ribosomal protein L24
MALVTITKNDDVIVLAGKDKGKTGKVVRVIKEKGKAIVEGINMATFHQKPNPNLDIEGGIIKKEVPIEISNLARYDVASNKALKLGVKFLENGDKVLFNKKTGEQVSD